MSDDRDEKKNILLRYGDASFKKDEKLRLSEDFAYVKSSGMRLQGRFFILNVAKPRGVKSRVAFIASRKFSKKAVERNRAKRIMREIYRNSKGAIEPCEIIFIPKKNILSKNIIADAQKEFLNLMKEAGKCKI